MANSRYDCIRNMNPAIHAITVEFKTEEDLTTIGGQKTVLRLFNRDYEINTYDPEKAAKEVEDFIAEMNVRADAIAEKYGFRTVLRAD